jgi:hypothetical protein
MQTNNEHGNGRFSGGPGPADAEQPDQGDAPTSGAADPADVPLARQFAELREYLAHYVSARADALGVRLRTAAVWGVAALMAGLGLSVALATAVVLLLIGLAEGLAVFFGDRPWAGKLAVGGAILALTAILVWWGKSSWDQASTRELREKYARRRKRQRDHLRGDVRQRANEDFPRS